ncbi:squamosa promoter-binding-like protein 12 [Tanacetum coccineum]
MLNLSDVGLDIQAIACPVCSKGIESNDHFFYSRDVALNIWQLVRIWLDVNIPMLNSHSDWESWVDNFRASSEVKLRMQVMEWNWDNEVPKSLAVSSHENGEYLRGEDMERGFSNGIMEEGSVISGEALFGLKLGQETYNQDKLRMSSIPLVTTSLCSPAVKKSRAVYQSSHSSRCQVEGCNLDLVSAKDYHRRHKICADHSKSPKVVVAGLERRLHDLSEFDDRKRSCRRRLSAHNARRRRPQSDDKFSSSHRRPHMGFFVNGVSTSTPSANSTPQSSSNFKREDVDMISSGALSDISSSFHGVAPRLVNQDVIVAGTGDEAVDGDGDGDYEKRLFL